MVLGVGVVLAGCSTQADVTATATRQPSSRDVTVNDVTADDVAESDVTAIDVTVNDVAVNDVAARRDVIESDVQSDLPTDIAVVRPGAIDEFCEPRALEAAGRVTAIHPVVDGVLLGPCFTSVENPLGDRRLTDAWEVLDVIAPDDVVDAISFAAAYERCDDCSTVGFVQVLDDASSIVALALDVTADEDDLEVTITHEMAHVIAQRPGSQLDPWTKSTSCHTYHDGTGCLAGNAHLWAWIQEFWPTGDPAGFAAMPCDTGSPFTSEYAAGRPEEDFAEVFAAYVLDISVDPALADKLAFFDRRPEFVAIRGAARAAGLSRPDAAGFAGCAT